MSGRIYGAIDLKSFYASVECMERGLNPLTTNLVVADAERTEKTICLAVSPSLKSYGVSGRARLFQVVQRVKEVNAQRLLQAPGGAFTGATSDNTLLMSSPHLALDYIAAPPRMAHYVEWSSRIYQVYLKYIAPEDMHVYSIDEVFMDLTAYLGTYKMTPRQLIAKIVLDVLQTTGVSASAGIGTNLYLAKIAMDIGAKHARPDADGLRIAYLDEMTYRKTLWDHRPLTDFWRVGPGLTKKLESNGLFTMGDIARCSLGKPNEFYNEAFLHKLFGVNAELLIDHAWGLEPCTIADIKVYKPKSQSIVSGQVLPVPYDYSDARLVVKEMADSLALELVDKGLKTDQLVLTVGYDIENLQDPRRKSNYQGEIVVDTYGRQLPKAGHGTHNLAQTTSSGKELVLAATTLYDRIADPGLLVRRLTLTGNRLQEEDAEQGVPTFQQLDFFTDLEEDAEAKAALEREQKRQETILAIKKKFGKNAILKGMNLQEKATAQDRNERIGGHKK